MLHIKFWRTKYIFVLEIFLEVALWGQVLPLSNISILHSLNGLIFKSSLMIPTFHANFRALIVLGSIYQLILLWCQRLAFCNKLHMFVVIIGSSPGAIFFELLANSLNALSTEPAERKNTVNKWLYETMEVLHLIIQLLRVILFATIWKSSLGHVYLFVHNFDIPKNTVLAVADMN